MTTASVEARDAVKEHPVLAGVLGVGAVFGVIGGVAAAFAAALFAGSFIDGYVFWKLWGWFAQPIGAPTLGYWAALGVITLVRFARPSELQPEREGQGKIKTPLANYVLRLAIYPALVLGFGAFVHSRLV